MKKGRDLREPQKMTLNSEEAHILRACLRYRKAMARDGRSDIIKINKLLKRLENEPN